MKTIALVEREVKTARMWHKSMLELVKANGPDCGTVRVEKWMRDQAMKRARQAREDLINVNVGDK